MPSKRPQGPVIRWDVPEEETVTDTALADRMEFLAAGAELAAHLTLAARAGSVDKLGTAVVLLTRDQLEAACMSFALLAATGAPVVDDA